LEELAVELAAGYLNGQLGAASYWTDDNCLSGAYSFASGGWEGSPVHDGNAAGMFVVRTFPTSDLVFAEYVREVLHRTSRGNDEHVRGELEASLRHVYPRVRVSIRNDVAGFGDILLYVFRDGSVAASNMAEDWIEDPAASRLVTDPTGTYVEINEPAERLFGRTAAEMIGRKAGSFTRPEDRVEDAEAVWRALEQSGRLHSLAIISCPTGVDTPVEYVTVKDGDGRGRNVTYLRERH
jgi:PAS domain S-box-containing protein